MDPRKTTKSRKTNETDIRVSLNLDGTGEHRIAMIFHARDLLDAIHRLGDFALRMPDDEAAAGDDVDAPAAPEMERGKKFERYATSNCTAQTPRWIPSRPTSFAA